MSTPEPHNTEPRIVLDAADAIELGEALAWLRDWFSFDHDNLARSMRRHSFGLFALDDIDADLDRFARMLGVDS